MEDMHGSTFRNSRTERERRRATGPVLTVVHGGDGLPAPTRVAPRAHPAFEGFTPDGLPGDHARAAVHSSGPEATSGRTTSRGNTSPGVRGPVHSGPGPHVPQAELVRRIADQLAAFDADRAAPTGTGPAATVVRLHR